jgi:hypothetical protein
LVVLLVLVAPGLNEPVRTPTPSNTASNPRHTLNPDTPHISATPEAS